MKIYTIGEISKISNIPIKTLRFYDEKGLLSPEFRNEENNYRYYSEKQIVQILIIKSLKPFGLSLKEIKNIISCKNDNPLLLEKLKNRIEVIKSDINILAQQLSALEQVYSSFANGIGILSQRDESGKKQKFCHYPVEIIRIPKNYVLFTRYISQLNVSKLFFERCLELQRLRDKYNLYHSGPLMGIFCDGYSSQFSFENGDLELCMPIVKPKNFTCEYIKMLGGFLTAGTIHIGHYRNSLDVYRYLTSWIKQNKYVISGAPIEQYILDPCSSSNVDHYVTRISFPIKE